MPSIRFVASIVSLAVAVSAQGSHAPAYGRFPCGTETAPDDSKCTAAYINANYQSIYASGYTPIVNPAGAPPPLKSAGYPPLDSQCVPATGTGMSYCGWEGATCTSDLDDNTVNTKCDNGQCVNGKCSGNVGADCNGLDALCLGYITCSSTYIGGTELTTCGQAGTYADSVADPPVNKGAACNDPRLMGTTTTQTQSMEDTVCAADAYCNQQAAACTLYAALGEACPPNQAFGCQSLNGNPLVCTTLPGATTGICAIAVPVSGVPRARRNDMLKRRGVCPSSHTACPLPDSRRGFECIDIQTNLEQCGACSTAGGVDCTALPGVDAVGCVSGQCEIWACAEGFAYDSASASCKAALVL